MSKFYAHGQFRLFPEKIRSILYILIALLCGITSSLVTATPLPSDLSISGSLEFDEAFSETTVGDATHIGSITRTIGGTTSTTTINNLTVTGSNPLAGNLTDNGDGWSIHAAIGGSFNQVEAENPNDYYDLLFDLMNLSATDSFLVTVTLAFNNHVDSSGEDAFAESVIEFFDGSNQSLFFSDLSSDTVFANRINGIDLVNDFGGPLDDSGLFSHNIILNPGDSLNDFRISVLTLRGGAFVLDSSYSAFLDSTITFSARNIAPPNPTPEPGILALLGIGLFGLLRFNKRRQ